MKEIERPPDWYDILRKNETQVARLAVSEEMQQLIELANDQYLYWAEFKHRKMPAAVSRELAWAFLRFSRSIHSRSTNLNNPDGTPFSYWLPDSILRDLHFVDQHATGHILLDEPGISSTDRDRYLINSLMEEAIASSILEGAATTRAKAKEMLRTGRRPQNHGEQMVVNNYETMRRVKDLIAQPLSLELVCELQASITRDTLEDPTASGRFRTKEDGLIQVIDRADGRVLHTPPPAGELPSRLQLLCQYANETTETGFTYPVVKAVILHFWLAFEHPFVDGNGRTARALFYWYLSKHKYWLLEYLPISRIFLRSPAKYARAFLYSETDDGDLTYFISFNLRALRIAIRELREYVTRRQRELGEATRLLRDVRRLNQRQRQLLHHAINHPDASYTIAQHMRIYGVVYQTARTDLLALSRRGFLTKVRQGKTFYFIPSASLAQRLKIE